jgi:putative spermidine/putrescine transport system permease protein
MLHWRTRQNIVTAILGFFTLAFLAYQWAPIFTLATLSFAGPTGGTTFPMNGVSFHWYRDLWEATSTSDFKQPMLRSFILGIVCSATTVVLSLTAVQAVRGRFRGNGLFFYLILLGLMAPGLLVGFGVAIVSRLVGVQLDWKTTTFLVHISGTLPFGFLTLLAVFNRFDVKLEEAALTLGANRWTTFWRITFPIILPGVIGAALAGFSLSYDEFARSLFTTGVDLTLPLMVMAQFDKQLTPTLYAIGTLTTAFSLLVILVGTSLFWFTRRRNARV